MVALLWLHGLKVPHSYVWKLVLAVRGTCVFRRLTLALSHSGSVLRGLVVVHKCFLSLSIYHIC